MASTLEYVAAGHSTIAPLHKLEYMSGIDNEQASEALPGALPVGQNNPQIVSPQDGSILRCGGLPWLQD